MSTISQYFTPKGLVKDFLAGIIVFLVALPLCLGIALASNAPLFSGLVAGIVGGILVGLLSGSQTSVTGPAAGLTAIVAAQITSLGSFNTFLLAVFIAGIIQIGMGIAKAGILSSFFPSSVIKGLLAAIGVILILKQLPYLLGHDMKSTEVSAPNIIIEMKHIFIGEIHLGALVVGLLSMAFLIVWDKIKVLKKSLVPAPLLVVVFGVIVSQIFRTLGGDWVLSNPDRFMVQVPVAENPMQFLGFFTMPDFKQLSNEAVYITAITIAIVASLETLLNLEAVDRLDKKQRTSPASRELFAQGVGNMTCGLIGGLPVTSVIIRGSVNINAGSETKLSAVIHGVLLLGCVMLLPVYLNFIPLSCLAAILLMTGFKLVSINLMKQMWKDGFYQFFPFIITLLAIVISDLLIGIVIGLIVSVFFVLNSNMRRPIRRYVERHVGGDVLHIELANQVSFLNRAALENVLRSAKPGSHILLDGRNTDYIDPDVLSLIKDFKAETAPIYNIQVSLKGFRDKYQLQDEIQYVDYTTRELQEQLTPEKVLRYLIEGNKRFRLGRSLERDYNRQINSTAARQSPMAVILSCIDSRAPVELVFDLGIGDVFSARIAGNVTSTGLVGSIEYACAIAGAKLIMVMGHTRCGAVGAAVEYVCKERTIAEDTGCQLIDPLIQEISHSIDRHVCSTIHKKNPSQIQDYANEVATKNVRHSIQRILEMSIKLKELVNEGKIAIVGAVYDVASGEIHYLFDHSVGLNLDDVKALTETVS
ncbi:MAG: SulP family inorganic anion transporter [Zavarzinella sp.]